jgi:N-acetyl-anhydromuramoyl-L-alanine amidase
MMLSDVQRPAAVPRLSVERDAHRLRGVRFVASPNCDGRPDPEDISVLVVHAISLPPGEFGGPWVEHLFTNALDCGAHPYFRALETLRVSAHVFISRDGGLAQFVPFDRRAWHAGESCFDGRSGVNDFSIGVELEGCDDQPFADAQYRRLVEVTQALTQAYPRLSPERIVGHSDIAPGRKSDPGPCFDWLRFLCALEYAR